jgi:hypothetical protein
MTNLYTVLKKQQQEEINNFPMVFAFNDKQFEEAMEKLGLTKKDTDKVYSFGGGGIYRKTDSQALRDMFDKHEKEMQEAIDNDLTGDGFIYDMFDYELANHEFGYTWDSEPTLEALGLTMEEVQANEKLLRGFNKAKKNQ